MTTTIETTRIIKPENLLDSRALRTAAPNNKITFERATRIAVEAMSLAAVFSARVGYLGNVAILSFSSYTLMQANRTSEAVCHAACAILVYAKPVAAGQVIFGVTGVIRLFQGLSELWKGAGIQTASKNFLLAAYHFTYVGVLATANPQIIAISLVAQTVYSLNKAYNYHTAKNEYEAGFTFAHGALSLLAAFNRRNDLAAPLSAYSNAATQFKDWALAQPNVVQSTVSNITFDGVKNGASAQASSLTSSLSNFSFTGVKDWFVDQTDLFVLAAGRINRKVTRLALTNSAAV